MDKRMDLYEDVDKPGYSYPCCLDKASVCLVWVFMSQSIAMVMLGRSVHLTALFSSASLTKQLTSTPCTYFRLYLTTTLLKSAKWEENGHRNYFMINLSENMVPGWD